MALTPLGESLDLALEARLDESAARLAGQLALTSDGGMRARLYSISALAAALGGRYAAARRGVEAARTSAVDPDSAAWVAAITTFVSCVTPPVEGFAPAECPDIDGLGDEDAALAGYIAVEASMSAGRLVDAERLALAYLDRELAASVQAPVFTAIALARSLVFQGRLADAAAAAARADTAAQAHGGYPARMLAAATSAYIAAQYDDGAETERLTALVVALDPDPSSYITVGSHILCAYGLAAVGRTMQAARMVLHAGGGNALPRLQTVDRAYAYELLATDAIERDDLAAARAWGRRAAPLAIHDMAAAAVERTLSRIDTAMGRNASGAERAAVSGARALVAGGRLDAARSLVLEASALAATGARHAALAGLRGAALEAESLGAIAVRSWSARELRRLGRRLRPANGAGWGVLSPREQQVALLAAEGYSNRMIGQALFLSERTVQSHLSRALAALGVSSRASLPASLGRERGSTDQLAGLTFRQQQVATLVAEGCSNREISAQLGISDKTVEKHVQAIFGRWQLSSRTGIANRVLAPLPRDRSA